MARTTIDIDDPILRDLKRLQRIDRKPLGRLVSDLLARALADLKQGAAPAAPFKWTTKRMGAKIDFADKDAVYEVLDRKS